MWQTPVSRSSPSNTTPFRLELLRVLGDVGNADREAGVVRPTELAADHLEVEQVEEDVVAELELGEAAARVLDLRQAERLAVARRSRRSTSVTGTQMKSTRSTIMRRTSYGAGVRCRRDP